VSTVTDYEQFLIEHGLTEADMASLTDLGYIKTADKVRLAPSPVHGTGTFAEVDFAAGSLVSLAQVDGLRTEAGRFTNHDPAPNVLMVRLEGNLVLMALRDIKADEELFLDYRQAFYESDFGEARRKVAALEAAMQSQPQVDCPVKHHFAPGVYIREMTIPTGVVLTGAVHKTSHLSMLSKGHIYLVGDTDTVELRAPATVLSQPGTKRAIYAVEEAIWTTIHATDTVDLDELVAELTESKSDELLGGANNTQLGHAAQQQLRIDP